MLKLIEKVDASIRAEASLTLPYDLRQKSRLRMRLDNGVEAGLFLPRGSILRDGDHLRAESGCVVAVHAAQEKVSTLRSGRWTTIPSP